MMLRKSSFVLALLVMPAHAAKTYLLPLQDQPLTRTVALAANVDLATLDIQWQVDLAAPAGSQPFLRVDADESLFDFAENFVESGSTLTLQVTAKGECGHSSTTTVERSHPNATMMERSLLNATTTELFAAKAKGASLWLPLWPICAMLARDWAMVVGCSLLALHGTGASSCEQLDSSKLILTLVAPVNQAVEVNACGNCPEEMRKRYTNFQVRPPCDINQAAQTLHSVAASCDFDAAACPLSSCFGRWCTFEAPPANCGLPEVVADACYEAAQWVDVSQLQFRDELLTAMQQISPDTKGPQLLEYYKGCESGVTAVEGRPYMSIDGPVLAAAQLVPAGASHSQWCTEPQESFGVSTGDWNLELAAKAAEQWLLHGRHEHASVASFSRFSLDLLRFAAPPQLLRRSHEAAADEVRHAQLAFGLAAALQPGALVEVGSFPLHSETELTADLPSLAKLAFNEGCEGESHAVSRLAFALAEVHIDSPARPVIEELLRDEARHAALAWATVQWSGAATSISVAQTDDAIGRAVGVSAEEEQLLRWAGRVPQGKALAIADVAQRSWVLPWLRSLAEGRALPVVDTPGSVGEAVSRASALVREALQSMVESMEELQ